MGLSVPLALLGLVLVAGPVVAHLLRRADVRTRSLPTVELLRRAAVESKRRVRVVDPWLLLLRVVLVALAALALAGPFFRVELAYGDGRVASVAIVLDDSMSMAVAAADGRGTRFDEAVRRAQVIVGALPDGSEIVIVRGGRRPRVVVPRTTDVEAARAVLGALAMPAGSARGTDLGAAVEVAARQLAGARHALRRIVVLSDFAGPASGEALVAPEGSVLDAERVGGDAAPANVALTSVLVDRDGGGGTRLAIEARAFGDAAPVRVPATVAWRGRTLATAELALERGAGRVVVTFEAPGTSEELEAAPHALVSLTTGDALAADDARAVLLRSPTAPRVLVVDGRPSALARRAPGEEDGARFVRDALALVPREGGGPFVTRIADTAGLLAAAPGSADVLVLSGLDLSAERVAGAVRAHVEGGAGVLWAAGPAAPPGSEGRLDDLFPARVVSVVDGPIEGLVREEGAAILGPGATGLDHVRVLRRLRLEPGEAADVVLRFTDGAPALVVSRARRTAMLALALDAGTSDLPYRPGFLPLLSRVLGAVARPGAMPDEPVMPGDVPPLTVARGGEVELTLPNGALLRRSVAGGLVPLDDLEVAGAYLVAVPDAAGALAASPRSAFVVAPPAAESDLEPGALPPRLEAAEAAPADARVLVERPLGRWVFLVVGVLAALEGLLRVRRPSRAARGSSGGVPA